MTPELWKALIGAVVLFLTSGAALFKVWTELAKVKAERAEVGAKRDADSQALHDQVQKLTWENSRLREDMQFLKSGLDDHQQQLSVLNTELAKVSTKLDSALEILRDLKEAQ
jgi:peptidoglycan hydrolase CwlO-like protein